MITTHKMRSHGKSNGKTYAKILDCCFRCIYIFPDNTLPQVQ